jgi:hypothetical protein
MEWAERAREGIERMPNAKLEAFFGEKRRVTINEKWKKG